MKCDICQTTQSLLTEGTKNKLRPDWAGIDFYNELCWNCWETIKEER